MASGRATKTVVVPSPLKWRQKVAAGGIHLLGRGLMKTWRCEVIDRTKQLQGEGEQGPLIFCVWHNRLAWSMRFWQLVRRRRPAQGLVAMISASRDGGLLAQVLRKFSVQPVRGSTSRRGPQALLETARWIRKGFHVAITPDGPRGPRYRVQPGIISLAQLSGCLIIPVGANTRSKIVLRSWDGFQIPLPAARCEMILDEPLRVPRDASETDRESLRRELEARMTALIAD